MIRSLWKPVFLGFAVGYAFVVFAKGKAQVVATDFKAEKVTGAAQAWEPFHAGWRKIKPGDTLADGTLISLEPGSKARFVSQAAKTPATVDVAGPMIFRMERDALRKIELSKNVKTEAQRNSAGKEAEENMLPSFDEAWKRISASIIAKPGEEAEKGKVKDGAVGVSGDLDLFLPQQQGPLVPRSLPTEMRLSWTAKDGKPRPAYRVVVKRPGTDKHEEVTTTTLDQHYLTLDVPGTYTVRVETADGTMRSIEHKIEVLAPLSDAVGEGKKDQVPVPVRLLRPASGLRLIGVKAPVTVGFDWLDREAVGGGVRYDLVVSTKAGAPVATVSTNGQSATVTLKAGGIYLWYVDAHRNNGRETETVERSEVQSFEVASMARLAFKDVLKSESSTSVYFDH